MIESRMWFICKIKSRNMRMVRSCCFVKINAAAVNVMPFYLFTVDK